MIDMMYDEALGILHCVSRGSTPIPELELFTQKAVSLQARALHGCCLILVDASEAAVHTQETAAHFSALAETTTQPGDRSAIIIHSAIAKLQSQRMAPKDATGYFTNEKDAVAWRTSRRPDVQSVTAGSVRTSSSTRSASSRRQISRSGR
ncbi:hypothetical protein BH10PSE14_BH10PSE14_02950 [soil metagenome]